MVVEDLNRLANLNEWRATQGLPPLADFPGSVHRHHALEIQRQEDQQMAAIAARYLSQHSRPGAHGSIPTKG